jgi:hypothetical protein
MSSSFKFAGWKDRFRAPLFAALVLALACNSSDSLTSANSADTADVPTLSAPEDIGIVPVGSGEIADTSLASVSYAGGIPIGLFHQPTSYFGSRYNGSVHAAGPTDLMSKLSAIKARGGKVVLSLSGSQKYFKDSDGHFSFTKWKARVDRFRNVRFSSYISDGTIVGHYLIDEPQDAANFNGRKVGGATLEAMAKYSKQIWPSMVTIVRAEPYLIQWSGTYRYLDAAWAQYLWRKGNVNDYLRKNVSYAQKMGLALVVGLNIPDGGNPHQSTMSPSEVQNWGSALLSSSYPCAFLSWKYGDGALLTSGMKSAMDYLRRKAQSRSSKSCRG